MFSWNSNSELNGILVVRVNDFFWTGTPKFEQSIINQIKQIFKISKEFTDMFKYVGINVQTKPDGISVNQHSYIASLKPVHLTPDRKSNKNSVTNVLEQKQL